MSLRDHPSYGRVFLTFARNSMVRDMTFRSNFVIQCISSLCWATMFLGFYALIFKYSPMMGAGTGWGKWEFFVFLATTHFVNSVVQAFFMPNADEFSELIRTGELDFVLLKPVDTQFLVSLKRIEWSSLSNFLFALLLLAVSLWKLGFVPTPLQTLLYVVYVVCGIIILYSLMIAMAAVSVWFGRNQSLYQFWFYVTNFSRYPMEIYQGAFGTPLRQFFTFIVPVLVVVNVPARLMRKPLTLQGLEDAWLPGFALAATALSFLVSRLIFNRSLLSYRSASS